MIIEQEKLSCNNKIYHNTMCQNQPTVEHKPQCCLKWKAIQNNAPNFRSGKFARIFRQRYAMISF